MTIYEKLFELRKQAGTVSKNAKNPFYGNKYFDINGLIDHLQPYLEEYKLLLLQPIKEGVQYSIIRDIENDEELSSGIALPDGVKPQDLGSAITYYRRYTLQSLLALQAEDDDGNKSSKPVLKKGSAQYNKVVDAIEAGKAVATDAQKKYIVPSDVMAALQEVEQNAQ